MTGGRLPRVFEVAVAIHLADYSRLWYPVQGLL